MVRSRAHIALLTTVVVTACSSSGGEPAAPPPSCTVTNVSVSPPSSDVFVGATLQLTASVASSNCSPVPQTSWQSSATSVASVSSLGVVTGVAEGSATISASAGGQSGSTAVTVRRVPVASVTVTAPSTTVLVGATLQGAAEPRSATGAALSGRTVTWQSSNEGRATVSSSGLITGVSAGTVTITATSEGQSGTLAITVAGAPTLQVTSLTPASGASDVSIESTIRIQFSAAVTVSSVSPTTVLVSRVGGGTVAGTFAVSGSTVTFTPTGTLNEFATNYTVTVTTGVRSTVGNFLAAQFSSTFATAFWDPGYYYRISNAAFGGTSLDTYSGTFGCFLGSSGTFTGQYWYFVPIAGQAGFSYMKNQFQGETKALEGSDAPNRCFLTNLASGNQFFTGQAWRAVAYGAPYANGYRLQNQNLGTAKSLGAVVGNNETLASMQATANVSSQVWSFVRLQRR